MKYLPKILAFTLISLGVGALVAHAQDYTPLAPLPGTFTETSGVKTTTMSMYLSGAIKLLIALGSALAVLYAIIGGTQYVAAGITPDAKSGAKERITNALIGLAIILTSYLLLNSINPKLVDVSFELAPVTVAPPSVVGVQVVVPGAVAWPDDATERAQLSPVQVNKSNCTVADKTAPGGTNCTSIYGLASDVITKIKNLQSDCKCSIIVTAGTEYWLHKSHNNNRTVDLSKDSGLNTYITKGGASSASNCGVPDDPHYQTDGAMYVDEPNRDSNGNINGTGRHWHVCY